MLNKLKNKTLVRISADVFMCQQHFTGNGLDYWNLRLLSHGKLIEAFHWGNVEQARINYKENDGIMIIGRWSSKNKERLQILHSHIVTPLAANDELYDPDQPLQLELDFDNIQLIKEA